MLHRLIKKKLESLEELRLPQDRRSGIERRRTSYVAHIPERRSGRDRRISDELWKELNRTPSGSALLETHYSHGHNLTG